MGWLALTYLSSGRDILILNGGTDIMVEQANIDINVEDNVTILIPNQPDVVIEVTDNVLISSDQKNIEVDT